MKNRLNILFLIISINFIFANGDDCPNCYNPIANAGEAVIYSYGCSNSITQICLDGSGSSDYEEAMLTYNWTLHNVEKSSGNFSSDEWPNLPDGWNSNISNSSPCFDAPSYSEELYYTFKLLVNDGDYTSNPDFVTITVSENNTAPYFNVIPESSYSLKLNESFILDLSSLSDTTLNGSTANGYVLDVNLSEFLSVGLDYVDNGNYIYTVTAVSLFESLASSNIYISDGCSDLQFSVNTQIIGNEAPYSIAGQNQNIWSGASFTLDAGLSFDPDGDLFDYYWTIPDDLLGQMDTQSVNDQILSFTSDSNLETEYIFELNLQESAGQELSSVPNNGEDIFFSEYYEPVSSSYPKYIEVYNSTIDKIDLSDYEIWYVDDAYQWSGSNLASSFPATGKLLFNSCLGPDEGGNLVPLSSMNGAPLLTAQDCCEQLARGYDVSNGAPYSEAQGNFGKCVELDENNNIINTFDDIYISGTCYAETFGAGTWLVPYFYEEGEDYLSQCKSVDFADTSLEPTIIDENISSSDWIPSCVDNNLDVDEVTQQKTDLLDELSTLVLSYSDHQDLNDKNYKLWDQVQHNGSQSYAIIKKTNGNLEGEIIDVIGDAQGNSSLSWVQNALRDSRLIRKEKIFKGNHNWNKSFGSSSDESEWYRITNEDLLNDFSNAGSHYCGACTNILKVTTITNTEPVAIINTADFIATLGSTFTIDGSSSYDPDNYDVYYHWEAEDGIGLGCADGISSSEIECCEQNSINCVEGSSETEKICCIESFGVWNVSDEGNLGDICDDNCCFTNQNPWIESYWEYDSFCFDTISLTEESCCVNNGGSWVVLDADTSICTNSNSEWNGERCEIVEYVNNPELCCSYGRDINDEFIDGGVWDSSLNICLGGTSFYKDNGQCFGGNELSNWNFIDNHKSANPTFTIINEPGNCNGDYNVSEGECCIDNPGVGFCNDGSGGTEEECCDDNGVAYCTDGISSTAQECCENNCNDYDCWDENAPNPYGSAGLCVENFSAEWIQTYWDNEESICVNDTDAWVGTYWNEDTNDCENGSGSWNSTGILPITLYVSDGFNTTSSILQINVTQNNQSPEAISFVEKIKYGNNEEIDYFLLCSNPSYTNQIDCENNGFAWKGVAYEGYTVYLNGSSSSDVTNTGYLEYRWDPPAGVSLSSNEVANPHFVIDEYIAPLVEDCSYSFVYPEQYNEGRDCWLGYCSNDNAACSLNSDCCGCDVSSPDYQNCADDCENTCIDYVTEEDCCLGNGGVWSLVDESCNGIAGITWNDDNTWNNCYLELDFVLNVSDGGFINQDFSLPSAGQDVTTVRIKPRMPIVGSIQSDNIVSGSTVSSNEGEYVKFYTYTKDNSLEEQLTGYSFDPELNHNLKFDWSAEGGDGKPDLIKSGYCSDCENLLQTDCENLVYCNWNINNSECENLNCSSFNQENDCIEKFYCQWDSGGCAPQNILFEDLPCIYSDCEFLGYDCIQNNAGGESCCEPSIQDGVLDCVDNGYSCELGSLCFENFPSECIGLDEADCGNLVYCNWNVNNLECDDYDINNLESCVDEEELIFFKTPIGIRDFVDYDISLLVKDSDEELIEYRDSETETITMRVGASYPVSSAGYDKVYTSGYPQIILDGYKSHDPQAGKIDYSFWGPNCTDGLSPTKSLCESSNSTWYEGGIWYKISNLGLLAFYEETISNNGDFISSTLSSIDGYEFNWRYSLLGNCEADNSFCYNDDDCGDSVDCLENPHKSVYLPNGFLYEYIDGQNEFDPLDITMVNPFFHAPTLVDEEPIRLFFELTVIDDNNFDSSIKVSLKDTVLIDIVPNAPPTANAGESKRVRVGSDMIMLDGSKSFDETPLGELNYLWTSDDNVVIHKADEKRAYINIPTDLCQTDGVSLNEKACCEENGGVWLSSQECSSDNHISWVNEKDLSFHLSVCEGDCSDGLIDSDTINITYSAYSYPVQPILNKKTDHESVKLFWDAVSEESIDELSLYSDFQGYKIYKSEDYGQTWGDPIYRNGELKGWEPYYQFDLSFETDSLFCLYKFSDEDCETLRLENIRGNVNWYPGYDWQQLGSNTGLVHSFIDTSVTDGIEYTYSITAYDRGYKPDTLQYGSYGKLEQTEGLYWWNNDIWVPNKPKYIFTEEIEADSFYFYKFDIPIRKSEILNQKHLFTLEIPPDWGVDSDEGIVSQEQVDEGVSVFNTNSVWPSSNPDGYPSMFSFETSIGSEGDQNYVLATPGYNASNITYPDNDDLSDFVTPDCRAIGNGDIFYDIVDENDLTDDLVKLEIQAFENASAVFDGHKSDNPCLYIYDVMPYNAENGREEHVLNLYTFDSEQNEYMINDDCVENCKGESCDLDNENCKYCSYCSYDLVYDEGFDLPENDIEDIFEKSNLTAVNSSFLSSDFTFDNVLDLPGVIVDTLDGVQATLYLPDYMLSCYPIKHIDALDNEDNWSEYFRGISMKVDNAPGEIPETFVARTKKSYFSEVPVDTTDSNWSDYNLLSLFNQSTTIEVGFGIQLILDDPYGHLNLLYYDDDAFNKKASYKYEIEFIDPLVNHPDTVAFSSTDASSTFYEACGRNFSTLIPFKIKNLTTNKYVQLTHTDNGKWNGDGNLADFDFPTPGIIETHPGYKDCVWTPGERLSFYQDTTSVGSYGNVAEEVERTFKLELIYNQETVQLLRPDMCGFNNPPDDNLIAMDEFALNTRYNAGDCVLYEGLVWHATTDVSNDEFNIPNVYYEVNGQNQNPWKPVHPWHDGTKIVVEPSSWFVDGDYWVGDMSSLGRLNEITENDLENISVVPNPYIVSSKFNEDSNGNRIRFTRLPSKCRISIFTISGELVKVIEHENINNDTDSNEWWNLKNSRGRNVAPGLYIYHVETDNGLSKVGKFSIVR